MKTTRLSRTILIAFLLAMTILPIIASCQYATFYAQKYEGRKTSNGDIFTQSKFTCASNDFPIGTILRVYYNSKWVDVRVNDKMHHTKRGYIDLSTTAFEVIAKLKQGKIKVKIEIIKKA